MRQRSSAGLHGFVLHDACWCLLKEACEPEPIPLGRLLMMCESLPFPLRTRGVCWGHDYGQLLVLDTQNHYPWHEQFHQLSGKISASCIRENPFDIPDLAGIISNLTVPPAGRKVSTPGGDCFYRLPWEIREIIANLLPTNDALKLRLACKSFLDLYSSAIFWSSRFKVDCERGFLFEVRGCRDIAKLRSLYRTTASSRRPPALRNRQRIWCLGRQLIKIARQSRGDKTGDPELQIVASKEWIRLAGDEQVEEPTNTWKPFARGCRPIDTIVVAVPERLESIGITTISLGALDYVTGIRLLAKGGPDACAGYQSDGDEILYPLRGLRGFRLAVGPGGVRALQVIDHDGCSSRWIGRAAGIPISERLVGSESLESLRVTIDVCNARWLYMLVAYCVSRVSRSLALRSHSSKHPIFRFRSSPCHSDKQHCGIHLFLPRRSSLMKGHSQVRIRFGRVIDHLFGSVSAANEADTLNILWGCLLNTRMGCILWSLFIMTTCVERVSLESSVAAIRTIYHRVQSSKWTALLGSELKPLKLVYIRTNILEPTISLSMVL